MIWTALVLAGSRGPADPVAAAAGVSHKAFAPLAGKPMIAHVLNALAAAPGIGRVAVSIEPGAPELPDGVVRLDAAASPARSVLAALETEAAPLLVVTADHPLMTPAMLRDFLAAAEATGADVAAAVARREVVEAAGNPARRTYLKFRDDSFSGCNMFAIRTTNGAKAVSFWRRIEQNRKRPMAMAREIGLFALLGYATGRLSSAGAAKAIGRAAGCSAALVALDHPDAAHDVDKPDDLAFAARRLGSR
jgi:GTP:adenosylcobinamide-phosphate guanylyltransferase